MAALENIDDNLSFVLNAIQDVSFHQRPVPKTREFLHYTPRVLVHNSPPVGDHEILVQVKKTGSSFPTVSRQSDDLLDLI